MLFRISVSNIIHPAKPGYGMLSFPGKDSLEITVGELVFTSWIDAVVEKELVILFIIGWF